MFELREDDLSSDQTRELLELHLEGMRKSSPPGSVFALDLTGLKAPAVTVWSAWEGERIASIGAMKRLADGTAEVKSMRTHPDFARRGAAQLLLDRIIAAAKESGALRLSLETGSGPAFDAALGLYRRNGFANGAPFADYEQSAFNQFLHLELTQAPPP
ncbi:GNAT family N-acetyltransferase [Sphingopyxis sp. JAI128]|uniref:GNAT family N-acetyltransferase n=1 Tax=Sphingopyxis sp. JAI128 TaxID=2723066 RepID=UPI001613073D|nr:GNAT family N-acetyltransferase [Sphingopyxis sp. JAI128]MBB6426898.1 putative acetyltransferase [Sphingopyxis sp. JAI128]